MTKLKPCPKCGETTDGDCVHLQRLVDLWGDGEGWQVMCENCGYETDEYKTPEQAATAWNADDGGKTK
mgnify:CR=1 FL=1